MARAEGGCGKCDAPLVILQWVDGKRKIVVACYKCRLNMHFDLDTLLSIIGEDGDRLTRMLEDFHPSGPPS